MPRSSTRGGSAAEPRGVVPRSRRISAPGHRYDREMPDFVAPDAAQLAFHTVGTGDPLVCLPGGPMKASAYLGDLGGLSSHRTLHLLDLRGTGDSPAPADAATYRVDRQVDDVEALRAHLGLEQLDLLAHSAGAALALLYAARHPERVQRLVLVCPTPRVVGLEVSTGDRRATAERPRGEPWFSDAFAAFERIWAGTQTDQDWDAIEPFMHGQWDAARRAWVAEEAGMLNAAAAAEYYAAGAIDPATVTRALGRLHAPALVVAGEFDVALPPSRGADYAARFPQAELLVMPSSGHSPWLDDAARFVEGVEGFLG